MKKVAIYNPYLETRGGGEKVCLALAESIIKNHDSRVDLLVHKKINLESLENYFKLNLKNTRVVVINTDTSFMKILGSIHIPGRAINLMKDYIVRRYIKKNKYDLFINNCYQSNMASPIKNSIYMCMFPQKFNNFHELSRLKVIYIKFFNFLNRLLFYPSHKLPVSNYSLITSNSEYTKSYIKKMWGLESKILYPICEDMNESRGSDKKKIILSVGRFFANSGDNHHKRQDFMIDAFSELDDLFKKGWELHLAGSVAENKETLVYLLELFDKANNIPVHFHLNRPFSELKELYNKASIYWHATGYGSDPDKFPEKQEHFGITTVEAMSAGCIPVVLNSAGQKETVVHKHSGFLWNTKDDLLKYTRVVTSLSANEVKHLRSNSIYEAKKFNHSSFDKSVKDILNDIF